MKRALLVLCLCAGIVTGVAYAGVREDFQQAVQLYNQGKIAEALNLFQKVARKQAKNAEVRYYIALCHLKQQRWQAALNNANLALERNPDLIKAYVAKATALIGLEQYDAALETLRTALEKAPEHPEVHYTMGIAWSYKKDYPAAIAAFKKVVENQPQRAYAHYYLGLNYYNAGQKAAAIASFQRFLELAPDAPEAPRVRELLRRIQG